MCPEIVRKRDYDGKPVDMWALGILLYVMLTGVFPFKGADEKDLYAKIIRGQFRNNHEALCNDARRIIGRLLDPDVRRRMTASELLRDPFVQCTDVRLTAFEHVGAFFTRAKNNPDVPVSRQKEMLSRRGIIEAHR
jgi:serine/threonine protein kinase